MSAPDPALDLMRALVLDNGSRWAEIATKHQLADAEGVLGRRKRRRRHWLGRSRGYSKTTDLAAMTLAALAGDVMAEGDNGFAVAADRDQTRHRVGPDQPV